MPEPSRSSKRQRCPQPPAPAGGAAHRPGHTHLRLAILAESYLSFLGAGTPPHIPSWGNVIAEGRAYVQLGVWIILFPGRYFINRRSTQLIGRQINKQGLTDAADLAIISDNYGTQCTTGRWIRGVVETAR
jgi:hypothetical protein